MIVLRDEDKPQVGGQRGAGSSKRYRNAAVSPLPDGKDIPALDLCSWELGTGLAEDV